MFYHFITLFHNTQSFVLSYHLTVLMALYIYFSLSVVTAAQVRTCCRVPPCDINMSRPLACFFFPPRARKNTNLKRCSSCRPGLHAKQIRHVNHHALGGPTPHHVKRRQRRWPTLPWDRFLIDRESKQTGVLSTSAGLHGGQTWNVHLLALSHAFPQAFALVVQLIA